MSNLFNYLYDECIGDYVHDKKYNKLCNYLYGTIIERYDSFYCGSTIIEYDKYVFYGGEPISKSYFDDTDNYICLRSYENDNIDITYSYRNKKLHVDTVCYTNFEHYKYFRIYYIDNVCSDDTPYNIICYPLKINKDICINTETNQLKIIDD